MTADVALPTPPVAPPPASLAPTAAQRLALRVIQFGALAIVLAVVTFHIFELDRFFVPKELVLHLTALLSGALLARSIRRIEFTRAEKMLLAFVLLSVVSALFATNVWLATRAVAISASGVLLYFCGRALRDAGLARPLLSALALAVTAAAFTSLLQTYGVDVDFFSENRAPGGTLGNRNFVAHAAAFGWPLLLLAALRARSGGAFFLRALMVVIATAVLVLTRSRGAWLAFAIAGVVYFVATLLCAPLRRNGRVWRRLFFILLLTAGGVAATLLLPNSLRWRSDNPYLQTMKRVADYQGGSGHGRLIQYEHSLGMALRNPIFGVGPGNWPVEYPAHAARNDPSLDDNDSGMTANPWPSSDWVAFICERGVIATALLALGLLGIAAAAIRQLARAADAEEGLVAVALVSTLAAAGVAGLFDAVLLLALPTLIVWTAVGALSRSEALELPERMGVSRTSLFFLLVLAAVGLARSSAQIVAMQIYATDAGRSALERAARIDPGSYRVQLRLARSGRRQQRCEHARAARALFPHAGAAKEVSRGCGE